MTPASSLSNNELYSKLLEAIKLEGKNNKEEIKVEIKNETHKTAEEIKIQIKEENNKLRDIIEQQNQKITFLQNNCDHLINRCLNLERTTRKNNIIIFGLSIDNHDISLLEFALNKLNSLLEIDLRESDINNIFIIKSDKGDLVKVEFISYLKKNLIFKNITKLKGTKIFIANDLCIEDRATQKILQQHLKLARSKNYFAKIKGQTLIINGEVYTAQKLQNIPLDGIETGTPNKTLVTECMSLKVSSAPSTPKPISDEAIELENNILNTPRASESPLSPPAKKKKTQERSNSSSSLIDQRQTRAKSVVKKSEVDK